MNDKQIMKYYIEKYKIEDYFNYGKIPTFDYIIFQKGDVILSEYKMSEYVFILVEGIVKVFLTSSQGKNLYIARMKAPQILGETASLWGLEPSANVQAQSSVICLGIRLSKYRQTLHNDSTWLKYISEKMATRLRSNNVHFTEIIQNSNRAKLATLIINNAVDLVYDLSLVETSEFLGISYRHLLRILNELFEMKIIKKYRKSLYIVDKKKLGDIAKSLR